MSGKIAATDHTVHEFISSRWSPYAFADKPVSQADLCSLFEAARWAPSSMNEQPWHYIVATKENPAEFERLLSCLVEGNQEWAKHVPVLALGITATKFSRGDRVNRCAFHDLGLAAGNLLCEATSRGISVHQMAGIVPDKAREIYAIPDGYEVVTGIAIGYKGDPATLPERLKDRDVSARQRKPLTQFVYSGKWGSASDFVASR
jgi:nitroreductase